MELTIIEYICKGKRFFLDKRVELAIVCFESAISEGISDDDLLIEVQNELGNAYLSINAYEKALNVHMKNMDLAKSINNLSMESISYANITIALTSLGRFQEAIAYCSTHLKFSKKLENGLETVHALFNMGNIFYYNAKTLGATFPLESIQFSEKIENHLETASSHFKSALLENKVVKDKILEMKILGNYSNVQYLLRNFKKSIKLNTRKLNLSVELNDKESEKRSYLNRGNSYVLLKNYKCAINDFKLALYIAKILKDVISEINLLYTLSNTYYLSQYFELAVESMINYRDMVIARNNKQCESRANLCLSIIYSVFGDYDLSEVYAKNHLTTSLELKDDKQCAIADGNLKAILKMKNYLEHEKFKLFSPWIILSSRKKVKTSVNLPEFVQFQDLTEKTTLKLNNNDTESEYIIESPEEFLKNAYQFQLEKLKDKNNDVNLAQLKDQFIDYNSSAKKIFLNSLANLQGDRMDDQRTVLPIHR